MKYETITISEWGQLLDLEPEFGGWVYRGHADKNWELETSLRRVISNNQRGYHPDDAKFGFGERASLRSFKSRAHFYLDNLPEPNDSAGWLSVMQHHGTPTRLLDFSYSLYVACYFALINAEKDACVWAIDDGWLRTQGTEYAMSLGINPTNTLRFGQLSSIYNAANLVISQNNFDTDDCGNPELAVLMIEIERQIPRLAIQQGMFLMPTNLNASFSENLNAMGLDDAEGFPRIKKLIFPYEIRGHALMHLEMMNITAETLFPGIDGFAASLIQRDML